MNAKEENQVLIVKNKHSTFYFHIRNNRELHNVCLQILASRLKNHFYDPWGKVQELKRDSDKASDVYNEVVAKQNTPSAILQALRKTLNQIWDKFKLVERQENFYNEVVLFINVNQNHEFEDTDYFYDKRHLYRLLQTRSEYEYEYVELVTMDEPLPENVPDYI